MSAQGTSELTIGVIFPEVLGTYGDGGNAVVLAARARMREIPARIVTINVGEAIPDSLDIYTLGGGEDIAQAIVCESVTPGSGLYRAVDRGAPLLAICAGLQVLGNWYEDAQRNRVRGLGIIDCETSPRGKRAIGELVTEPLLPELTDALTGFENHGGRTQLGAGAKPLGRVRFGIGNDSGCGEYSAVDGAVQGSVIATYMHGPALARNPQLADLLLARALGKNLQELSPLELPEVAALRAERLHAAANGAAAV